MILVHHFKQRAWSVILIHQNHNVMSVVIIHPVIQIVHSMFEAGEKGAIVFVFRIEVPLSVMNPYGWSL